MTCVLLISLLIGVWLGSATASDSSSPIATYQDGQTSQTVSLAEYHSWLDFQKAEDSPQERLSQVKALVLVKALAADARRQGLDRQPRLQFLFAQTERKLLQQSLYTHVVNAVRVSAQEVETAYAAHPKAFHKPRRVQLFNLYKRVPLDATPAERKAIRARVEALRQSLLAGADFRQLVRRESDSQTRFEGGRMGLVQAGQLRPEVDAVAMQLKAGQISDIIETDDGFTILRSGAVLEARTPSPVQMRTDIHTALLDDKCQKRWQAVQQELLTAAKPTPLPVPADLATVPAETQLVRFGAHTLTLEQLHFMLEQQGIRTPPHELPAARLQTLVNKYIGQVMIADRARQKGLAKDPELRNTLSWTQRRLLSNESLRLRVAKRFVPLTPAEIRTYFEAHRADFQHRPAFDLAAIRLRVDELSVTEQYRRAGTLSRQLQSGQVDFAQAAKRHSDLPSASKGGRLGWFPQPRLKSLGRVFLKRSPPCRQTQ